MKKIGKIMDDKSKELDVIGSGTEEKPRFGERDEALARKQEAYSAANEGYYARLQRNSMQQFSSIAGSKPVLAGRQVGFELLGYGLFNIVFGFFFNFIRGFAFPEHTVRSDELTDMFIETRDLGYMADLLKHELVFSLINAVLATLFLALLLGVVGRTPGGILGGYRMVDVDSGDPVKFTRALAYFTVYSLAGAVYIPAFLIWLSPFFDSESGWYRGWLYRMIGTVAVDTRGNSPHGKRMV